MSSTEDRVRRTGHFISQDWRVANGNKTSGLSTIGFIVHAKGSPALSSTAIISTVTASVDGEKKRSRLTHTSTASDSSLPVNSTWGNRTVGAGRVGTKMDHKGS